jgi:excisionase family DNA binding protein
MLKEKIMNSKNRISAAIQPTGLKQNDIEFPPADQDIPLSTGDVAKLLNIHTNTVRRWNRSGLLKSFRIGPRGDRRFKREEVEKLCNHGT